MPDPGLNQKRLTEGGESGSMSSNSDTFQYAMKFKAYLAQALDLSLILPNPKIYFIYL
jgi:hypothetical protein